MSSNYVAVAVLAALCVLVAQTQGQSPFGGAGMGGMPAQSPQQMQQYLMLSSLYGVNFARTLMAEQAARMMGNNPMSRYLVGERYDMPDSWWLTSSAMNGQNPMGMAAAMRFD